MSVPSYVHVTCMVGLCNNFFCFFGTEMVLQWAQNVKDKLCEKFNIK